MHPGRMVVNLLVLTVLMAALFWVVVRAAVALSEVMGIQ